MVSIIENWARIEGVVVGIANNLRLPGYVLLEVELKNSFEVESFPNLAKADEGQLIQVNVKKIGLEAHGISLNATISCTVRKFFGRLYFMK